MRRSPRRTNSATSHLRWPFVNDVADIAESANHHPDIDIRWNRVRLTLSTHSAGGLTELDLDVADRIERVFGDSHAPTDQF